MYIDRPLREYLNDLAARKPTPGGGSAAALAASIGTSLISMVANYTIGNPKYKDVEKKTLDILEKARGFGAELEALIDEDVAAYSRLSKILKEAGKDDSRRDAAYREAMDPPFRVCRISGECLKLCGELAECGNKNLITDTAIAAIMLEGAFFSAKFNVYVNLKYIKDADFIGRTHEVLSALEESVPKLKEEILEKCEDVIAK